MTLEEGISFSEIAAFLLSLGRDDVVVDILPEFRGGNLGQELDDRVKIDEEFVRSNGEKISEALLQQVSAISESDADDALSLMVASMQLLSRISNSANQTSLGQVGNLVVKKMSKWKAKADKIKTKLGATGYTIGVNLGFGLGVYVEMHF